MCLQKTARGGELFVGNAFCDQFHATVNSKMAAGKHQIIAFWMSPDGVSVEIKMTFSHTIDFMDSFLASASLIWFRAMTRSIRVFWSA